MTRRTKALAALVSSAALVGAGSTASAEAHNGPGHHHHGQAELRHHHGGHHHGLARAAAALGVTTDQLKTAVKAVAAQDPQSKDAWEAALAQQLGTTADKVDAAFSCHHGDDGAPPTND
jgi:hypothetical protein